MLITRALSLSRLCLCQPAPQHCRGYRLISKDSLLPSRCRAWPRLVVRQKHHSAAGIGLAGGLCLSAFPRRGRSSQVGYGIAGIHFALQARIRRFPGKIARYVRCKASDCCEVLHSFLFGLVLLAFSGCSPLRWQPLKASRTLRCTPHDLCVACALRANKYSAASIGLRTFYGSFGQCWLMLSAY